MVERVTVGAGHADLPQLALDPAAGLIEVRDLGSGESLRQVLAGLTHHGGQLKAVATAAANLRNMDPDLIRIQAPHQPEPRIPGATSRVYDP